eukprot:12072824-Ditylum_brightwellii.AAC.1
MGYEEAEIFATTKPIGTMQRVKLINKDTILLHSQMSPGMIDKIMYLKKWYIEWISEGGKELGIKTDFTKEVWDQFIIEQFKQKEEQEKEERAALALKEEEGAEQKFSPRKTVALAPMTTNNRGLNVSYKVDMREIPKLPAHKALKGKIFDNWHSSFYVKMYQAKLTDLLSEGYTVPKQGDVYYDDYKMQDDFLKNHLLTATLESNTSSFINVRTMTGLETYEKLLSVYQGTKYEEDKAVNAAGDFKKMKFTRNSHLTPETYLAKVNKSLKQMEVDDGK